MRLTKRERTHAAAPERRVLLPSVAGRMSQPFSCAPGSSGCPCLSVANKSTQKCNRSVPACGACDCLKDQLLCVRLPESESA